MCQSIWESEDEAIREAHGSRKFCTHHHPALADGKNHAETGPLATIQGCSQSTMETMSTLTTATSLPSMPNINIAAQLFHDKDADVQEFNIPQEDENDAEALPPLKHIWDFAYVQNDPPTGWKCLWCSDLFVPVHATRALYHVLRLKGGGIKPCKASIPANYLSRYQAMRDDGESQADSKKCGVEVVDDIVRMQQNLSVATLLAKQHQCGSVA
jgi:hypothetical protein